jgi:hypothetical protein
MNETEVVVPRSELQEAVWDLGTKVLDSPNVSDDVREAARKVFDGIGFWLLFDDRNWRLLPYLMGWPEAIAYRVEEVLAEIPEPVRTANPAWVQMARHFAKLADRHGFGADARLEFLDVAQMAIDRLRDAIDDDED